MINVTSLLKSGSRLLNDNAPALLTAFGAVGVVGTAVLTGKASFEAAEKLRDIEAENNIDNEDTGRTYVLTTSQKIQAVWPLYIGAVTSGVLSCGAIVMSHRISARRAAVLAAAYALNEGKLEEYQDKIKEKFGVKKEKEARTELTQDRINRDYNETEVLFHPTDGLVLMREDYTGRFFWSSVEAINKAVNEINAHINKEGSARISDFYDVLDLSHVSTSDYFGWTREDPLAIDWDTCTTPDGKTPVHSFEYVTHPIKDPEREASFR